MHEIKNFVMVKFHDFKNFYIIRRLNTLLNGKSPKLKKSQYII